jgi:hypothetical protein
LLAREREIVYPPARDGANEIRIAAVKESFGSAIERIMLVVAP